MSPLSSVIHRTELTPDEVAYATAYLAATREALIDSTTGLGGEQWQYKSAPNCWSVAEIIEHITLVEYAVHKIVEAIHDAPAASDNWDFANMDRFIVAEIPSRGTPRQSPAHLLPVHGWSGPMAISNFLESRAHSLRLLSRPSLRGRVTPHPVCGPWDGYHWLLGTAAHSARHTGQILEVRADPGWLTN